MRSFLLAAAAAIVASGPVLAQEPAGGAPQAVDPAQSKAVYEAYRGECGAKAPKELCECLIGVAGSQIGDPEERKVFYDYTTGNVDAARTGRATFDVQRNMKFNVLLQQAETAVHNQCDKLRPPPPSLAKPSPQPTTQPSQQ